jgi:hypothetical protein
VVAGSGEAAGVAGVSAGVAVPLVSLVPLASVSTTGVGIAASFTGVTLPLPGKE